MDSIQKLALFVCLWAIIFLLISIVSTLKDIRNHVHRIADTNDFALLRRQYGEDQTMTTSCYINYGVSSPNFDAFLGNSTLSTPPGEITNRDGQP